MASSLAKGSLGTMVLGESRMLLHGAAYGLLAAGGLSTGYLAAGSLRGATIGACVHVGLFSGLGAVFGGSRLTRVERMVYGGLSVATIACASYLFWTRR